MTPSRPGARGGLSAARHVTLACDLLCQASLVCASRPHGEPTSRPIHAERVAAAQREIRCAAYMISALLPAERRRRAESSVWDRLFEYAVAPSGSVDQVLALLEHAQATSEYMLRTCNASEDEYLAALHVGLARHELECTIA